MRTDAPVARILEDPAPGGDRLWWPEVQLVWPDPLTWRLLSPSSFEWTKEGYPRQKFVAPAGAEINGASIPWLAELYLRRELILPEAFPHDLIYERQGFLSPSWHLYWNDEQKRWMPTHHVWTRKEGDRLFGRMLRLNPKIRPDQRQAAYRAVRLFGWWAWRRGGRGQ